MHKHYWFLILGALVLGTAMWFAWKPKSATAPTNVTTTNTTTQATTNIANANTNTGQAMNTFSTADLPDRDPALEFSLHIPTGWRVEYLPGPKAINIYDASDKKLTSFESSRLVIRAQGTDINAIPTGFTNVNSSALRTSPTTIKIYQLSGTGAVGEKTSLPAYATNDVTMAIVTSGNAGFTVMKSPLVDDQLFATLLTSLTFH